MPNSKQQTTTAADYLDLARASFAQVRATRDAPTARVLARMGQTYLEKAKALGEGPNSAEEPAKH